MQSHTHTYNFLPSTVLFFFWAPKAVDSTIVPWVQGITVSATFKTGGRITGVPPQSHYSVQLEDSCCYHDSAPQGWDSGPVGCSASTWGCWWSLPSTSVMDMAASTCRHRSWKDFQSSLVYQPRDSGGVACWPPPWFSQRAKPKQMGCAQDGLSPGGGSFFYRLHEIQKDILLRKYEGEGN